MKNFTFENYHPRTFSSHLWHGLSGAWLLWSREVTDDEEMTRCVMFGSTEYYRPTQSTITPKLRYQRRGNGDSLRFKSQSICDFNSQDIFTYYIYEYICLMAGVILKMCTTWRDGERYPDHLYTFMLMCIMLLCT